MRGAKFAHTQSHAFGDGIRRAPAFLNKKTVNSKKLSKILISLISLILLVAQLVLRTDAISKSPYIYIIFIYKRLIIQIWGFKLWLSSKEHNMGTKLNICYTKDTPRS